jgi:hypothetical protein
MHDVDELFQALSRSRFRSRFHLGVKEREYFESKGLEIVMQHARDFITRRLAPASPLNDGNQTPMRNHPVFIGQHATATCCRGCLEKWHRIPKHVQLSDAQIEYVLQVIQTWLMRQGGAGQQEP